MRTYRSALRREQADATRGRILDAVRDLLVESKGDLSIPEIAARARVSEPTIYRHFPNREALLEAASGAVAAHLGAPPEPREVDDLPVVAIALSEYFGRNAAWLRAALHEPALRPIRMAGRRRRLERFRAMLAPRLSHLQPRDRDIAFAALGAIARAETWDCLTREFGLTSDEAGLAKSFALRALLDALVESRQQNKEHLVDEVTIARGRAWRSAKTRKGKP
jgi:AcrR family transcriptional regulator